MVHESVWVSGEYGPFSPSLCPGLLPADIMMLVMHVGHQRTFLQEAEAVDLW